MNFDEYQRKLMAYRMPSADETYALLGLAGEAGEVCSLVAKGIRDGYNILELQASMKKELGDVLWFVAAIAESYNLSLNEIAQANYEKIASRFERGVLGGSGDDR